MICSDLSSPFFKFIKCILTEPFCILGKKTLLIYKKIVSAFTDTIQAERVGFEPTRPCGQTVFKTASL